MAYIGPIPAETFTSFATQTFSTSATSSYTLDHPVTNENELALFINNVRQQPGSGKAYTATGTALTLSANTASTDTMYAVFLGRALQTVNPAGGSVGSSQIAAEMITGTTALTSAPDDTDEFLISDAGTLKRIDYSLIKSGGLVLLSHTTISSSTANVQFTSGIDSTYDAYKFVISGARPVTDDVDLNVFFSVDAGSNYLSNPYQYALLSTDSGGNAENLQSGNAGDLRISGDDIGNATDESYSAEVVLYNPSNTTHHKHITFLGAYIDHASLPNFVVGAGSNTGSVAAVTGIKFEFSSGNIAEGSFTMYGIAKSIGDKLWHI